MPLDTILGVVASVRVVKGFWLIGAASVTLVVVGCKHPLTDKDLVGAWALAPQVTFPAKPPPDMSLILAPDHSYLLSTGGPMSLEGKWTFTGQAVSLTPTILNVRDPKRGLVRTPISTQGEARKPAPHNGGMADILAGGQQAESYEVSEDAKQLESGGKPVWIRSKE